MRQLGNTFTRMAHRYLTLFLRAGGIFRQAGSALDLLGHCHKRVVHIVHGNTNRLGRLMGFIGNSNQLTAVT